MRMIVLALAMLAAPAADADDAALKPFSFFKIVAGEVLAPPLLKGCGKGPDVSCINPLTKVSNSYVGYSFQTHNYKLSSLYIDTHPSNFADLLQAFTAKYGSPCETSTSIWKNAAGAAIENPTYHWCFSTGKLLFSKYGGRIDRMGILYEDDVNRRPNEAVVNF